jgi:hypothetical protein
MTTRAKPKATPDTDKVHAADPTGNDTVWSVGLEHDKDGEPLVTAGGKRIGTLKAVRAFLARVADEMPRPTEDELVGIWMTDQRAAGATNVDLKQVDDIRTGIRYALGTVD